MQPWGGVDHSPPSSAEVKGVQLYLYSPSGPSRCYRAQFTAYFIIYVIGYTCDEVSVFRCNDMNTFTYPLTWRQINTVSAWLPQTHLNTRTCIYVFRYTLPRDGRALMRYTVFLVYHLLLYTWPSVINTFSSLLLHELPFALRCCSSVMQPAARVFLTYTSQFQGVIFSAILIFNLDGNCAS